MSTPGMPSTSSASTASTVAERRSSSNIASSPKMSPGPERGERDLAAVGVLAHGARVAGADDVARVGVVVLAEDDLSAAEAPRHGDVRHAHQVLGAQGLEDRYAAEQSRRLLCARGHVPRSIPDQAMSSARSRRRWPSIAGGERAEAAEQRQRQQQRQHDHARCRRRPRARARRRAARRRASSGRRRSDRRGAAALGDELDGHVRVGGAVGDPPDRARAAEAMRALTDPQPRLDGLRLVERGRVGERAQQALALALRLAQAPARRHRLGRDVASRTGSARGPWRAARGRRAPCSGARSGIRSSNEPPARCRSRRTRRRRSRRRRRSTRRMPAATRSISRGRAASVSAALRSW